VNRYSGDRIQSASRCSGYVLEVSSSRRVLRHWRSYLRSVSLSAVAQSCRVLMIGDGDRYSDCTCQLGTRALYRERRRTSGRTTCFATGSQCSRSSNSAAAMVRHQLGRHQARNPRVSRGSRVSTPTKAIRIDEIDVNPTLRGQSRVSWFILTIALKYTNEMWTV